MTWDRFVLAARKAAAKDLRRVGRWLIALANRLDPPPLLRLLQDLGGLARLLPKTDSMPGPPWAPISREALAPLPGLDAALREFEEGERRRAKECGQIIYATGPAWGQISKPGGVCHLDRGHDGDHVPT